MPPGARVNKIPRAARAPAARARAKKTGRPFGYGPPRRRLCLPASALQVAARVSPPAGAAGRIGAETGSDL